MRVFSHCSAVAICAVLAVAIPAVGWAESDPTFTRLNKQGEQEYEDGKFPDAAYHLTQAYAIKPVPALLFNIARAYERAGNDEQAIRFYQRYIDTQGTDPETVKKSARALDLLRTRQADSKVAAERAQLEKAEKDKADAEKLAQENAAKEQAAKAQLAAQAAKPAPVVVVEAPPPSLVPGVAVLGIGAAAGIVGVVFGLSANSQQEAFNKTFDPVQRPQLRTSAQNRAHAADACFGAAVVAGGIGTYLVVHALGQRSAPAPAAAPTAIILDHGAAVAWSGSW